MPNNHPIFNFQFSTFNFFTTFESSYIKKPMTNFLAVVWDFDPVFFSIGKFEVRYYGVMWALAILLGAIFFYRFCKRENLPTKYADSIFLWGVIATVVGARLGHCFFYEPAYYLQHPLEIFAIRDGGLASHGAAIGLLIGLWGFSRKNKLPYLWSLDRIMVPVGVGGALVRLGNLFNSEIYGGPTELSWGFEFIRDSEWARPLAEGGGGSLPAHPTQIYEALFYLLTFGLLCWMYYRKDYGRRFPGVMFGVGLIGVFLSRFLLEFIKRPQVGFEEDMMLNMGQWLSLPFIIAGIAMIIYGFRHPAPPTLEGRGKQAHMMKKELDARKTAAKKK